LLLRRLPVLILITLLLPAPATHARQSDEQVWYYAITGGGQLVAYTADRQMNTLIAGGVGQDAYGWRLDAETGMALLAVDGARGLYRLEPTAAALLSPIPGGPAAFSAGPGVDGPLLRRLNGARWLIFDGGVTWLAVGAGEPVQIGFYNPDVILHPAEQVLSPDGRYLLVVDDPDFPARYRVWDTAAQDYVAQGAGSQAGDDTWTVQIAYGTGGFVVSRTLPAEAFLYRYADAAAVAIPAQDNRRYFEVLSDGAVLFWQQRAQGDLAPGIYHFDPVADVYRLLLPDATPLPFRVADG